MFIGRKKELAFLERMYDTNELQCVCVSGGAGMGKTAILQEFARRRRKACYCVRASTSNANKAAFCTELFAQGVIEYSGGSWLELLKRLCNKALGQKLIFIIDDVQELEKSFAELLPALGAVLQLQRDKLRLLLLFSGRDTVYVQQQFRKNGLLCQELHIEPLTYEETLPCLVPFSNEEKLLLYGVTGGIPQYLQYIDMEQSFRDNLYKLFFSPTAELLHEGERLLALQFRQPHIYHSILCSVACGAVRMRTIAEAVGMTDNKISKYISVLLHLGLLQKIIPADADKAKQSKNTCYMLTNQMLVFWYSFVYPYLSSITMGVGSLVLRTKVLPALEAYGRQLFLHICRQHCFLLRSRDDFGFAFTDIGFVWPKEECTPEALRLLAYDKGEVCFMQCVWNKTKVDIALLKQLQQQYQDVQGRKTFYMIFSRKGFTDRALGYAAKISNLRLLSLFYLK